MGYQTDQNVDKTLFEVDFLIFQNYYGDDVACSAIIERLDNIYEENLLFPYLQWLAGKLLQSSD